MTTEPEDDDGEVEFESDEPRPCILGDGDCVIADLDALDDDPDSEGVLAAQLIDGALFYLSARTREWVNADVSKRTKKPGLSRVK